MKRFKKLVTVLTVIAVLGAASAAYAATAKTPAEIAAGLTGQSVEALQQERAAGTTYGEIANEAGKLEEFKAQRLEQKKVTLDQRVAEGKITQEQADTIYNTMKNNQADCDGTGNAARVGKNAGKGLGAGQGPRAGAGVCNGSGAGACQGLNR